MDTKWKLEGLDTFSGEPYPIQGEYENEKAVYDAAIKKLEELERSQPSATSGGQKGIQDQIFVLTPDGSRFRFDRSTAQIMEIGLMWDDLNRPVI